ncbi:MAG: hydrogenase nickel incorporation protein HypB [Mycobacteriales bacterium]|nr:MAG: hydrogenase accessory protein HypB [Pseudonocardiales bacterium]
MCLTCGCSDQENVRVIDPSATSVDPHDHLHEHDHPHSHDHPHKHDHPHEHGPAGAGIGAGLEPGTVITLEEKILAKNDSLARRNRDWLASRGIHAVNLMSSPGAGKTTLLERTVRELGSELAVSVVEGDQETTLDADRITATGAPVIQVNTGSGCHLDAEMLDNALRKLEPAPDSLVFVENVGNLVCPALFDLGESAKIVIMSVTEGADKPLKYSTMFHTASLVLLNKIDLLPYVDFDLDQFADAVHRVSHHARVLQVSATTGDGLSDWYDWLRQLRARETAPAQ